MRSVARYLREPVWAFSAAEPGAALRLVGRTMRHHCANCAGGRGGGRGSELSRARARRMTQALNGPHAHVRRVGGDLTILYEIFARRRLLPARPNRLPPDSVSVVVDCGAHSRLEKRLYFANRYPHARVIAVEPTRQLSAPGAEHAGDPRIVRCTPASRIEAERTTSARRGEWGHSTGGAGSRW